MTDATKKLGDQGEALAKKFFKKLGYKILEQNFRTRLGEIDLIARDKNTLVFIEVKTRTSSAFGWPEEAVTATKKRHLATAVNIYLQQKKLFDQPFRCDILSIDFSGGKNPEIVHYKNIIF